VHAQLKLKVRPLRAHARKNIIVSGIGICVHVLKINNFYKKYPY